MHRSFDAPFRRCPLIAILLGLTPHEVIAIGDALFDAGFTLIGVPSNSPEPLDSIARLAKAFAGRAVIGAGTVLRGPEVDSVPEAGGTMIISPNTNVDVITATVRSGLVSLPGVATRAKRSPRLRPGQPRSNCFRPKAQVLQC